MLERAIAHQLDDSARVSSHQWLKDLPSPGLEGRQRPGLIFRYHPALADHIGGKDGGKATLGAFFGH
jgi:hypothetical protein